MMVDLNKLKPVDRRNFLKRGIQSGLVLVALPLWKNTAWGDPVTLLDGEEAAAALLSKEDLRKLLEAAMSRGGDFAEVYCEHTVQNSLSLDEDKISTATGGLDVGAGFRVVKGEKTGYAFSDDLDPARHKEAALAAALIADGQMRASPRAFKTLKLISFYILETDPDRVADKLKADLLFNANASGRGVDKRITQFRAGFSDTTKIITMANSEGLYVEDTQTLASLNTTALALGGKLR